MASQADAAPLERPPGSGKLAVIVALGVERACLDGPLARAGSRALEVVQSGPGPAPAARAAGAACAGGATALMSLGLAGALAPALAPGTIVLPERVITETAGQAAIDTRWRHALHALLAGRFAVANGVLLSTGHVLDVGEKAVAARATGAIACDMESATVGAAAAAAGIPFVALRVIADRASDRLPHGVAAWVDAAGNSRLAPVLAALSRPTEWRSICVLVSRFAAARNVLRRLAVELGTAEFGQPRGPDA